MEIATMRAFKALFNQYQQGTIRAGYIFKHPVDGKYVPNISTEYFTLMKDGISQTDKRISIQMVIAQHPIHR